MRCQEPGRKIFGNPAPRHSFFPSGLAFPAKPCTVPERGSASQGEGMMCQLDRLRQKRDEILGIAGKHNAEKVYVFGSCARKESRQSAPRRS